MEQLNIKQSKLLKTINKAGTLTYKNLSDEQKTVCNFLEINSYVSYGTSSQADEDSDHFQIWDEIESVSVTEAGRAYLYNEHTDNFRFTVPNIINSFLAIIAIIISIIALLK